MAKHRRSEKEQTAVWNALTEEEQARYRNMELGYALAGAQANRDEMRRLENLGFARLREVP